MIKFTRKTYFIIFAIVAAVIVIAVILYYIFRETPVKDPNEETPVPPVPPGSGTPKWVPESFPLNVGMFGSKTKKLQTALGISADGKFGTQTKASVIAKGKSVPLSQADYNIIVSPPAIGGGTNFQQIKTALAGGSTNFNGGISYLKQGQNKTYRFDFYTNGRFYVNTYNLNDALAKGTYSSGGKKMVIDGGSTYENLSVIINMTNIINSIE